jgi:aryl-alcohol dehydrogenase-like predicted oxidoreductase
MTTSELKNFQCRQLGRGGPLLAALGLGCMGMSEGYGAAEEGESLATLNRALDLGVNFIDTADIYGPHTNELLVGKAIRSRRAEVVLATKFGFVADRERAKERPINGSPEYARRACDASLERLQVETIDLWYLHRVDPCVPIEDTVGAMAELVGAGKVRRLGLSEVSPATLRRAHAVHPIAAVQSEYSLWTRDPEENGILSTCEELGVAFVPFSPLGRGFLTGAIRSPADFEPGDMRRNLPRFQGENFARNLRLADGVKALAQEKGCTPAQLALAWVLRKSPIAIPIPGTRQRKRLEENLGAFNVELYADDLTRIEALFPIGEAAGARYPEKMLSLVDR